MSPAPFGQTYVDVCKLKTKTSNSAKRGATNRDVAPLGLTQFKPGFQNVGFLLLFCFTAW